MLNRLLRRYSPFYLALLALAMLLYTLPNTVGAASTSSSIRVVTTTTILQDLVKEVAGDRAVVTSLTSPGMDAHTYRSRPSDLVTLSKADLIFVHGSGLDTWAHQLAQKLDSTTPVVVVTEELVAHAHHDDEGNLDLNDKHEHEHEHEREHGHEHDHDRDLGHDDEALHDDHEHGDVDPHFWFDPNWVKHYIEIIEGAFETLDPAGSDIYHENAEQYIAALSTLDAWIRSKIAEVPPNRRKLVTNHDTFRYFAHRYGFEVVGAVIPSFSTGTEPSARHIAQLARTLRDAGVPAVFTEMTVSPRLAETLAREVGEKVQVVPLFTESLSEREGPAATYLDFMRYNVTAIVNALK